MIDRYPSPMQYREITALLQQHIQESMQVKSYAGNSLAGLYKGKDW